MSNLLLAPFNDSMRLGQGYNSFLHTPCLGNAVDISNATFVETTGGDVPSQTVSYSARFVEKMSDVVRAMNISAGASIRSGSVSVSGGGNNIDEIKFAESDLNVVISVKVINQTRNLRDNIHFRGIDVKDMDETKFHDIYGDAFISGFIHGGDLHGIISIKTIDSSKKTEVKNKLRSQFNGKKSEWSPSSSQALSEALSETEVTVTVNWSGGGSIKPPNEEWTIDSLIRASSAFADNVAKCPQRTWAILTSYDTVPDFVVWAYNFARPLQVKRYDGVQRFTSELLDMYIEYKGSLVILNDAIRHPDRYEASTHKDAIKMDLDSLIKARNDLRAEMNKIVNKIEALDKNPVEVMKPPMEGDTGAAKTLKDEDVEAPELWRARLPFRKDMGGDGAKHDVIKSLLLGLPLHDEAKDRSSAHVRADPSQFFHLTTLFGSVTEEAESFSNLYDLDPTMDISEIKGSSNNGYMNFLYIKYNNNHEFTIGKSHPADRFFDFDIDIKNGERIVKAEIQVGTWKGNDSKRVGEISLATNFGERRLEWKSEAPVEESAGTEKTSQTTVTTKFKSESYSPLPKNSCIKGFWGYEKKGTKGGEEDGIWRLGIIWGSAAKVGEDVNKV